MAKVPADLVKRAKSGDVPAFEQLIAEHRERVYQFALTCCKSPTEAEDLAQEALIKAYRGIGSFREDSSFSTWLFRIVKNAFLDDIKSRAGKERQETSAMDDTDLPGHGDDPERKALRRQADDAVQEALAELAPDFRVVVTLFDVQGFSYEEIAEVLAIPIGTVKSRLARGRDSLRIALFQRRGALGSAWDIPQAPEGLKAP